MNGITSEQDITCLVQMNEQRLVANGVTRRRQNSQATIAEQILVALEKLDLALGIERLLRQHQRRIPFTPLHDQCRFRERVDIAGMIGMDVRDRNAADITRLHPASDKRLNQSMPPAPSLPAPRFRQPCR